MKRKTPVAGPQRSNDAESAGQQASGANAVLEEHRNVMSRGELIFYLRDVHRYWSTPRISFREIEELEQQNLIQRSITGICAIRLTEHGAKFKDQHLLKKS